MKQRQRKEGPGRVPEPRDLHVLPGCVGEALPVHGRRAQVRPAFEGHVVFKHNSTYTII